MKTKETTIKLKIACNDNFTHRYCIVKTWDTKKPKALVVMKNPSASSEELLESDLTTMLVINNLAKLGYGSVALCNLLSKIQAPHNCNPESEEHRENFEEIIKQAKNVDYIIIGWGTYGLGNFKAQAIQQELVNSLLPFKDKLMYIANPKAPKNPVHPLFPLVRNNWLLKPYSDIANLTSTKSKDNIITETKETTTTTK